MRYLLLGGGLLLSCSLLVRLTNAKECREGQVAACEQDELIFCVDGFEARLTCPTGTTCSAAEALCLSSCGDGLPGPEEFCFDTVPVSQTPLDHPSSAFVSADFDLNGAADIVSVGTDGINNSFQLLKGIGNGSFVVTADNENMGVDNTFQIETINLNGDDSFDLIYTDPDGSAFSSALFGGPTDFSGRQSISIGQCKGFSVDDMDGDGLVDIVSACDLSDSFVILRGTLDPAERFEPAPVSFPANTFNKGRFLVASSDWNNDGFLDLVFATSSELQFVEHVGDTSDFIFDVFDVILLESISFLRVLDFDDDGDDDVFVADGSDVILFENDGQANFEKTVVLSGDSLISFMSFEDVDLDGDDDMLLAFGEANLVEIHSNQDGVFRPVFSVSAPGFPTVVRLAPINDDDDFFDLVVASKLSSDISIFLSNR